jgi:lipooligosaccharide transport system ATP-binding protein
MTILTVQDLQKSYGEGAARLDVIRGLSFSLKPGECYGLLGPNGAGKTTTLKLCLGLTEPNSGRITLVGLPVPQDARRARMRIGVVPQGDNLDPDFTVEENLIVYARYFGLSRTQSESRIPWLLEFSNLTAKRHARIGELSGGMKKRVGIARAIVNQPNYLFCDEPNSGLDPQTAARIDDLILEITHEFKTTTVVVTHDMNSVMGIGEHIMFIYKGEQLWQGDSQSIMQSGVQALNDFIFSNAIMRTLRP